MIGQIELEDKIITVDNEDVQGLMGIGLRKLLAWKGRQAKRKITVLKNGAHSDGDRSC